jgi:protein translocase SecG subunit
MTTALIWILTPLLVFDCLLLGLLVLIQLPKKEAGVGMAFGGGATDALFGAGSGTALTKLTKYCAAIFFVLVFLLTILNIRAKNLGNSELRQQIQKSSGTAVPAMPPSLTSNAVTGSNALPLQPLVVPSNAPAPVEAGSNAPAAPPK